MTTHARRVLWFGVAGWFLAALTFFYAWVLRVSPSVMVDELMRDFGISAAVLGNLSAFYFYAYAAMQLPVGMSMDRWGPRRVLTVAMLIAGMGCALFALAPQVELAYAGRLLIGIGAGFGFVGSMVLAANWFAARRFALLSGVALAGGLLGGVAGQAPLAAFIAATDWRAAMWALAGAGVVLAILILAVVRDRPPDAPGAPPRTTESLGAALRGLGIVVRRPQTLLIAAAAMMLSTPILAFGGLWGVPYARLVYGIDRPEAAFLISTSLFGLVVGGPAWGWISDRIGRRRTPMLWGTVLSLATICALLYIPDLPKELFRILLFLFGFGGAAMAVSYAAGREHNADGATGAALGLINMMAVLGGAIFQPLVGLILDWLWALTDGQIVGGVRVYTPEMYRQALLTLPAVCVAGILACLFVRETYCRPIGEAAPATG